MICKTHNLFVRAGKCPECTQEVEEIRQLENEIRFIEKEIKEPIIIWEKK